MDDIVCNKFFQIDHILVPQCNFDMVYDCWTSRTDAIKSHQFPTILTVNLEFEFEGTARKPVKDLLALRQPGMTKKFAAQRRRMVRLVHLIRMSAISEMHLQ